jgi:hypothetical protein
MLKGSTPKEDIEKLRKERMERLEDERNLSTKL